LRADVSRVPFFPPARFERIMSLPRDRLNATVASPAASPAG